MGAESALPLADRSRAVASHRRPPPSAARRLLARKQKVLCKGKILSSLPPKTPLAEAGVASGSKLMLLAAAGAPSQGHASLAAAQQARAAAGQQRVAEAAAARPPPPRQAAGAMEARVAMWAKTGIAALRDLKLAAIPPELLTPAAAGAVRVADLGGNQLTALPPSFSALASLQKLRLSMNRLEDGGVPWEAVASLKQLVVLALDSNRLTCLPDCLSRLSRLQKLSADSNRLEALPGAVGALGELRALSLRGNRLTALPAALGACGRLEEVDCSVNPLAEIPPGLSRLGSLRTLLLDDTMQVSFWGGRHAAVPHIRQACSGCCFRLLSAPHELNSCVVCVCRVRSVPSELLTAASSLSTLALHGCPLTIEALRETPGFADYDARRRRKCDKQVDMRVLPRGRGFDEGADAVEWEHWRAG